MQLIDPNELIEFINGRISDGSEDPASQYTIIRDETLMEIGSKVKSMPTVDAVPVTRCKDCIYFTPEKSGDHWNVCRFYDAPKTADGYCNDAERKTDDLQ